MKGGQNLCSLHLNTLSLGRLLTLGPPEEIPELRRGIRLLQARPPLCSNSVLLAGIAAGPAFLLAPN